MEVGPGEVPFVFVLGLDDGPGGNGGEFFDVAKVDELKKEVLGLLYVEASP